jgi:uncharacterized Rmd1/YagE family protein
MQSRMARLEGAYEQVSLRLMNIDPRFDVLDRKIDMRFDAVDQKIEALDAKFDQRISAVDQRFSAVDQRFSALELRIDAKIDQRFMWTVGVVVTTWVTTIASIYLHH